MSIRVHTFTFNPFSENTYVLINGKDAAIIDPGCYTAQEQNELATFIEDNQLNVVGVWNTHCHIDHVMGNAFCIGKYNCPLLIPEHELELLKATPQYGQMWGINAEESPEPNAYIGSKLNLGSEELEVRSAPGHSPDHKVFIHHNSKTVMGGDVLFNGSIGRTDLPGGNFQTLEKSIKEELYTLPDDYEVYPGHGPTTTIGNEKSGNPFVKG